MADMAAWGAAEGADMAMHRTRPQTAAVGLGETGVALLDGCRQQRLDGADPGGLDDGDGAVLADPEPSGQGDPVDPRLQHAHEGFSMIIVTGATGALNGATVDHLLARVPAHQIAVAVRDVIRAQRFADAARPTIRAQTP